MSMSRVKPNKITKLNNTPYPSASIRVYPPISAVKKSHARIPDNQTTYRSGKRHNYPSDGATLSRFGAAISGGAIDL
jgi:hypothetical protein